MKVNWNSYGNGKGTKSVWQDSVMAPLWSIYYDEELELGMPIMIILVGYVNDLATAGH